MRTKLNLLAAGIFLAALGTGLGQSTLQFSTNYYYVAENAGSVILTVQRTGDPNAVVSVDYASANGTALAGSDYTATTGTLNFAAGETNQTIAVTILNDGIAEPAVYETFTVTLSNPTNAVLGTRAACTVRITDNDKGLAFEFASYSVAEDAGSVLIGVTRSDDGDFPVSVDYFTTDLTAIKALDYTGVTNTLFFAAGEKVQTFTVPILNDSLKENSKSFRLTLSNPTNQFLGSQKIVTITILDNDPGVQFEFNQYWVQENEGALTVKVLRGNDVALPLFTVDFATTNLTALAGQDYTETRGTLTFAAGETVKPITVPITYDEVQEADETFKLTLLTNGNEEIVLGPNKTATSTLLDTTGWRPHRFARIALLPDPSVQLSLGGGVHERFAPFFDLYPIEVSTNLLDWTPLEMLVRTNAVTAAPALQYAPAASELMRFFRTRPETVITPREPPTGPYAVGRLDRWVTDPGRRNRYNVSTNSSMWITVWYPAIQPTGQLPSTFVEEAIVRGALPQQWYGRVVVMSSYAFLNALLLPGTTPFPIVLASHGLDALRVQNDERAENLASHGYIVVATDHSDTLGVVFPDGSYHTAVAGNTSDTGLNNRVADLSFILDQLEAWSRDDPVFAGRLDPDRVAAMGMSWGGATAAEFCRVDSRCRASVLFDPGAFSATTLSQGLLKPAMTMNRADNADSGVFSKSVPGSVWLQITSTEHVSFSDVAFIYTGYSMPSICEADRTVDAYTLWFLNKYLKGSTEPMPALADYPRVINFKQK